MSLLDFLQSASNAVAGNVTGPVDLITLALRKAGVPVPEDAVGTSAWAKGKGLVRDVEPGAARVAGETAGILGPMLAVHYAPQIARSLLKAAENAAAPRTLNPQTGAIVWHGSPHKFDKFDSSKIGTGEGAQAYGHGLYLADSPEVARTYSADRAYVGAAMSGKPAAINYDDPAWIAQKTIDELGDPAKAKAHLEMVARTAAKHQTPETAAAVNGAIELIASGGVAPKGNLYKVDLPDEAIARMLDWDKPLSQQAQTARALRPVAGRVPGLDDALQPFELGSTTGRTVNDYISRALSPADAARLFKEAGIPGIRYLDGGSRAAGQGTSNYVVFSGNEDLLTILERNGIPIR